MFFVISVSYGFILQREKVAVTLLSVYAGIAVTQVFSPLLEKFFVGEKTIASVFINANVSPFTLKTAVFVGVIVLLVSRGGISGLRGRGLMMPIELVAYSFFNSALIFTQILSFAPEESRNALISSSKFASQLWKLADWWVILPIVVLIIIGSRRRPARELLDEL